MSMWTCQFCGKEFPDHYTAHLHAKRTKHLVTRPVTQYDGDRDE